MAARPWENRLFDNTNSVPKDIFDGYSSAKNNSDVITMPKRRSLGGDPQLTKQHSSCNKQRSQNGAPVRSESYTSNGPSMVASNYNGGSQSNSYLSPSTMQRTTSQGALRGSPATPPSNHKSSTPVLIRSASPRKSIKREEVEEGGSTVSTTARSTPSGLQRFGTRYSHTGSIRDDDSLASSPSVPNYMQATHSARAKVRSHSTPKQRPGTPEKEGSYGSAKKRLSFPISEHLISNSGPAMRPFRPAGYPQRSPSLKGVRSERSVSTVGNDSQNGDATPTSTEVSTCRAPFR